MKTTIELPDALAHRARVFAKQHGLTLRELVEAGLREELDRVESFAAPHTFRFRTVAGSGLRPGVQPQDLRELSYHT